MPKVAAHKVVSLGHDARRIYIFLVIVQPSSSFTAVYVGGYF